MTSSGGDEDEHDAITEAMVMVVSAVGMMMRMMMSKATCDNIYTIYRRETHQLVTKLSARAPACPVRFGSLPWWRLLGNGLTM